MILEIYLHPARDILVACLWSRWSAPGETDSLFFAAVTNRSPSEALLLTKTAVSSSLSLLIALKREQTT